MAEHAGTPGSWIMVGNAGYDAEDVAKLIDDLAKAKLAIAPPLPWHVRAEIDKVRAETAEAIAQAIETQARDKRGVLVWVCGYQDGIEEAIRIARGYTQPAAQPETGTPEDAPAQPTQERPLS